MLAYAGAGALVGLVNVAWLAGIDGAARLRDLPYALLARRAFDAAGVNLLPLLPIWMHRHVDPAQPGSLVAFGASAILLTATLAAAAGGLAAVFARLLVTLAAGTGLRRWIHDQSLTVATLALLLVPVHYPMLESPVVPMTTDRIGTLMVAHAGVNWGLLYLLFKRVGGSRVATGLGRLGAGLVGLALVVRVVGSLGADLRSPERVVRATGRRRPNLLLVSIDSLRADHLHCYGYSKATTPNLDRLAGEGARFTTVVAPTSWTLPSHATMLTGLPPEAHGVIFDWRRLGRASVTLAEVLRAAGYRTAAFVSGPYLDAIYGLGQGFELYDDYTASAGNQLTSHHGVTGPASIDATRAWLDDVALRDPDVPFFVFLHLWDVHADYEPPAPYDRMFDPDYAGTVTGRDVLLGSQVHAGLPERDLRHVVALYDGEIRFTDAQLGRLFAHLRAAGLFDETLVVVTADHGEEFFEHGNKGHRRALYDESILVPLIMRLPSRVPAGRVVDRQIRLMDVPVTILSLLGMDQSPAFGHRGAPLLFGARDLTALLEGAPGPDADELPAFAELDGSMAAMRTPTAKIIRDGTRGRRELYDLEADPAERRDLGDAVPARRQDLERALTGWRQQFIGHESHATVVHPDPDVERRLRDLGYLE